MLNMLLWHVITFDSVFQFQLGVDDIDNVQSKISKRVVMT